MHMVKKGSDNFMSIEFIILSYKDLIIRLIYALFINPFNLGFSFKGIRAALLYCTCIV